METLSLKIAKRKELSLQFLFIPKMSRKFYLCFSFQDFRTWYENCFYGIQFYKKYQYRKDDFYTSKEKHKL